MSSKNIVLHTTEDGLFDIVSLTEDLLDKALLFCKNHFCTSEALCKGTNVSQKPSTVLEFAKLLTLVYQDGLSFVTIEKSSNNIVNVIFFKLMTRNDSKGKSFFGKYAEEYNSDELATSLFEFLDQGCTKVNMFDHLNVENILDCVCLVTHEDYRRHQFGLKIVQFVIEIISKNKKSFLPEKHENILQNLDNFGFLAVCTSKYSKQIANKWGCQDIVAIDFSEFKNHEFAEKFPNSYKIVTVGCKLLDLTPNNEKYRS